MTNEELKLKLTDLYPAFIFEEGAAWLTASFESKDVLKLAKELSSGQVFHFDFLFCLTCVDWKTHLSLVYHLRSVKSGEIIVLKTKLDRADPVIDSVCSVWRTAEFHEREAYDLFGVKFQNHPDLRRLFLTDDWTGWPLRKDYEDKVNMIKL